MNPKGKIVASAALLGILLGASPLGAAEAAAVVDTTEFGSFEAAGPANGFNCTLGYDLGGTPDAVLYCRHCHGTYYPCTDILYVTTR
ncbi:MAG TPA: hypothetical protein VNZ52_04775 [Candidatus Thermoplasmatota archaeon]|nr:hypothetical protein [Candidatus Thermoplasmatota archaeon]